jgi:hypothetical protein
MTESTQGLLLFFAIAFLSSVLWHLLIKIYGLAILGATATSVVTFQGAAYVQLGYLDPLFLFAVATTTAMAFAVAALIGLPFRARRKPHGPSSHAL